MTGPAAASGRFSLGGDIAVNRLGFGAMRITGQGVWGEPRDPGEARRVLARLPALGIDLIDTADSYGPAVSERLIREVLHPYDGILVATKGGLTRPSAGRWVPKGDPEYLRQCVETSLERLGVSQIGLWQLHRIDPSVPRDLQFAVIRDMIGEGLIRHAGLSQVSVEEIEAARRYFPVATVQNLYNLADRSSEDVLDYCERHGIGFIPWFPLAAGDLARPGSKVATIAARHGASPGKIALAWLLARSPVMLPIPGTGSLAHLEENTDAASIRLSEADMSALDAIGLA
jgi:aryl-alcohol dehydrogenase-like predicted oxidoreductase